ncbi:hypothetical protein ABK040_002209 [Willaertia magna]
MPQKQSTQSSSSSIPYKNYSDIQSKTTTNIAIEIKEKSCGILLFKINNNNKIQFLLMKHSNRLDLPKGRMEPLETEIETAKREFLEETGIELNKIKIHSTFKFIEEYTYTTFRKKQKTIVNKTLEMYLAVLLKNDNNTINGNDEDKLNITEHIGYEWMDWNEMEEIDIQKKTINPLLKFVKEWKGEKTMEDILKELLLQR